MTRHILISLALVACGTGNIDGGGDGSGSGSGSGSGMPPGGEVTMTVHDGQAPAAGVIVVFQSNEGALLGDTMTDATGVATGKLPLGGMVSVVRPGVDGNPADYFTYVGVKAGDKLSLVRPAITGANPTTVSVRVPTSPDGGQITVMTPCGTGTGDAPLVEVTLDGCGAMTDFYVVDGDGAQAASFLKRAAIAPEVDLSAELFRANLTTTLTAANVLTDATVTLEERLETDLFRPVFTTGTLDATAGTVDANVADLPGVEQLVVATVNYNNSTQSLSSRGPYAATPSTLDVSIGLLSTVSELAIASETITWAEDPNGAATDAVVIVLRTATVTHTIAAPYAASVKLPLLPTSYNAYNLASTDIPTIEHSMIKVTGGYDAVRARIFNGELTDIAPMAGTSTVSTTVSQ